MKKCPHCGENVKNEAKKCKYCWEWLEEIDMSNNKWWFVDAIVRFFKYIWFSILSIIAISLFYLAIWLLLAMFASLSWWQLIFLVVFLWWLVSMIWSFLAMWIWYITLRMFNLVSNKKIARVIFTIILILMTIDKLFWIWSYSPDLSSIIKVIYTIIVIILCVGLCILSTSIAEWETF